MPRILLPAKYKPFGSFVLPVVVLLVVGILSATFVKSMVLAILETRANIAQLGKDREILIAKREILSSADLPTLSVDAQVSVLAVPDRDSTLSSVSSIRALAFEKNLQISDLKVGAGGTADARGSSLSFQLDGQLFSAMSFLRELARIAPIVRVTAVDLSSSGGIVSTELDLSSFWAELPRALPPASEELYGLSGTELEVLRELKSLRGRAVVATSPGVVAAKPAGKTNPFVD